MYYCRGAVQSAHCAEYWPIPVKQCEYCEWYSAGYGTPHYPMPAIHERVVYSLASDCYLECWLLVGDCVEDDILLAWRNL